MASGVQGKGGARARQGRAVAGARQDKDVVVGCKWYARVAGVHAGGWLVVVLRTTKETDEALGFARVVWVVVCDRWPMAGRWPHGAKKTQRLGWCSHCV